MPATILTSTHYDAVRGLIAPDVTAEHISDAYLSQDPFAPDAEREVRKRLSAEGIDVDTLTGEPLEVARLGMMHQCALGIVRRRGTNPSAGPDRNCHAGTRN